jgi:iron-regulated transporter 1
MEMSSSTSTTMEESSSITPVGESTPLITSISSQILSTSVSDSTTTTPSRSHREDDETSPPPTTTTTIVSATTLDKSRRLLYVSHFFNQFSENIWQFCLVLFLAAFSNYESLILVTSYGLVSYSFVCYFGSTAGRFIDAKNRLKVAQQFIGYENCCVLLATTLCYILLSHNSKQLQQDDDNTSGGSRNDLEGIPTDIKSVFLLIGIHLLGSIASVLDSGFLVAVERDWIVVMSRCAAAVTATTGVIDDSDEEKRQQQEQQIQRDWLSDTNVTMRQIDLSCKIVAPAIAGIFVGVFDNHNIGNNNDGDHGYDLRCAALLVGLLNALALIVEYICTAKIYHDIPDLAFKSVGTNKNALGERKNNHHINKIVNGDRIGRTKWLCCKIPNGLEVYFSQPVCWSGFSLSLLHLNVVLTFGGIMTAYLVWRGMNMEGIGLWRGVSSAAGLAGTFVYHLMAKKTQLVNVGMISVLFQFLCLTSSYASLFVDDRNTSFAMLIGGVCFSRIGLWVFDISVTQLMQENIPAPIRGLVGGVQQSLNAFFTLVAYAVGLFVSNPKYFYLYASTAYVGVGLAAVFFSQKVYSRRGRLHAITSNGTTTELNV